jgi:hypothetical protein
MGNRGLKRPPFAAQDVFAARYAACITLLHSALTGLREKKYFGSKLLFDFSSAR